MRLTSGRRGIAMLLVSIACGEDSANDSRAESTGSEGTAEGSTSPGQAQPEGSYHDLGPFQVLGTPNAAFEGATVLVNVTFEAGRVTMTYRGCREPERPEVTYSLEPLGGGDFLVVPPEGQKVDFFGGPRDEVQFHFSDPCRVEFTVRDGALSSRAPLSPGKACVVDWCDDEAPRNPIHDQVLVDYCEGEPTVECEE